MAAVPHGGLRPFHQKSTRLTSLTLGPNVVHNRSRNPRIPEATNFLYPSVWLRDVGKGPSVKERELIGSKSGPLKAIHFSRHKRPGRLVK